jgi:hypothetical protein
VKPVDGGARLAKLAQIALSSEKLMNFVFISILA